MDGDRGGGEGGDRASEGFDDGEVAFRFKKGEKDAS
jgi:hypothetical protein